MPEEISVCELVGCVTVGDCRFEELPKNTSTVSRLFHDTVGVRVQGEARVVFE